MDTGAGVMSTVETVLTALGTMVTQVFTWLGTALDFIVENPVILVPMLMFFVTGGVIGLITRLMRG